MQDTTQIMLVVGADVAEKLAQLAGTEVGPGQFLTAKIRKLCIEQREATDPGPAVIELHALIEVQVAQSNVAAQED